MSRTVKIVVGLVSFVASMATLYVFFDVGQLFRSSQWRVERESAPMSVVVASLDATTTTEDEATLKVTCGVPAPFQLNVIIDWHYSLLPVTSTEFSVQYRFNAEQFVSDRWFRTTATAMLMNGRENILRFMEKARRSDQLAVQTVSEVHGTMLATFDLHGAGDAISQVVEACDPSV